MQRAEGYYARSFTAVSPLNKRVRFDAICFHILIKLFFIYSSHPFIFHPKLGEIQDTLMPLLVPSWGSEWYEKKKNCKKKIKKNKNKNHKSGLVVHPKIVGRYRPHF